MKKCTSNVKHWKYVFLYDGCGFVIQKKYAECCCINNVGFAIIDYGPHPDSKCLLGGVLWDAVDGGPPRGFMQWQMCVPEGLLCGLGLRGGLWHRSLHRARHTRQRLHRDVFVESFHRSASC